MKPLGKRAYGSIPHLPGSKLGTHDKYIHAGQASILTANRRDRHDLILVQEKLDGTCVAVAKINGVIVPLIRAGYPAVSSRYEQHRLFAAWVYERHGTFNYVLRDGERLCGEWLAQTHTVRYELGKRPPFVAFDLMRDDERAPLAEIIERVIPEGIAIVPLLHWGVALPVQDALAALGEHGCYGAIDRPEGVVYRCERRGRVEFLAKFVREDFEPGKHLFGEDQWNWRPHDEQERDEASAQGVVRSVPSAAGPG